MIKPKAFMNKAFQENEEFANRKLVALLLKMESIIQQYFLLVQQLINQSEQITLASDNSVEGLNLSIPFHCF